MDTLRSLIFRLLRAVAKNRRCSRLGQTASPIAAARLLRRTGGSLYTALVKTKRHRLGCLFCFGGRGWIRTTEAESSRFTVCPLWPLGNSPILNLLPKTRMELVDGRSLYSKVCRACGIAAAHFAAKNITPRCFLHAAHPVRLRVRIKLVAYMELVDGLEPPTC